MQKIVNIIGCGVISIVVFAIPVICGIAFAIPFKTECIFALSIATIGEIGFLFSYLLSFLKKPTKK